MLPFSRLDELKNARPLIHCIANLVSANDCANVLLAAGASPMMAQAPEEMEEITAASAAAVLNLGTPDAARFAVCRLCGELATERRQPVVLDPVGVGASAWRLRETERLLETVTPAILRVNFGEAQALLHRAGRERGVDFAGGGAAEDRSSCARALARERRTVVLLTGPEDIVTDGERLCRVAGGSPWMTRVTGTGCMLSALCGAFAAAEPDVFTAAALAAAFWKVCAAQAEQSLGPGQGAGALRSALMDAASLLDGAALAALAGPVLS